MGELLLRLETEARAVRTLSPDEWADLGLPDGAVLLDPDRAVRWGGQIYEEMMVGFFDLAVPANVDKWKFFVRPGPL